MIIKKSYKLRLLSILLVFLALYLIILFRLFFVQIYQKNFFGLLAQQQYITEIRTKPSRALIYDRNQAPIVFNKKALSAFILPKKFKEKEKTRKILKKYFPHIYKRLNKKKKIQFLWLERQLSQDRVQEIKSLQSKDIHFLAEPRRFYPFSPLGHIVGFTDIDNIGIAGIEKLFNRRLGGTPSLFLLEKDARSGNFYFQKGVKKQGNVGDPITLTIDRNLQFFASEELEKAVLKHEAKGGAALIINPDTGDILAMASNPGFDPNDIRTVSIKDTKNIIATECFELGSVIKVFAALAALEEGVVTPDEEIDCEGKSTYIDGFRVENWKSLGPGLHPFSEVVARSNNVGIAKIAKRLGPKLYYHLRRVGFGDITGIRFPGERSGFVNPPSRWSKSSIIVLSFGYEIMATLLQLGKAFSIIANGGYAVHPRLVMVPRASRHIMQYNRLYATESVDQIKKILELSGWLKDKYSINGFTIMGKTGTARSIKDGKYSKKDHIYTYAGIVEQGDYKRVIVTFIKKPRRAHMWATQVSTPLFYEIAKKIIVYDKARGLL